MAWIYLIVAGLFEIGWPLGLKLAQTNGSMKFLLLLIVIVSMVISGVLLFMAQRQIPIGTAYAVWTGIGAAGTFLVGIAFFHDSLSLMRIFGVLCIVIGVITLKLAH